MFPHAVIIDDILATGPIDLCNHEKQHSEQWGTHQSHVPHAVIIDDILAGGPKAGCHVQPSVAQAAERRS